MGASSMVARLKLYFFAFVLVAVLASGAGATETIKGAGSTFIDPIFLKWTEVYSKVDPSVQINYESIGSLQGIDKLLSHSIDFAASDAPLRLTQLDQPSCETLYFPVTLGAVVVIYNLPEVPSTARIRFTGSVLADIFLGKIRKWNDPAIVAVNPSVGLPDRDILVSYRQDGSGTSYTFTDYLSKVSTDWEKGPGRGMLVRWPVGLHAAGNEGIAEAVKSQAGGIGYVELTYAINNDLRFAQLQNREGNWVEASPESMTAAADDLISQMPSDLKQSITDAPGAAAYPISSYSYLLMFKRQGETSKVESFRKFVSWVLHDGQAYAKELHYGALPANLLATANDQLKQVETVAAGSSAESCKATLGLVPHQTEP
ncbi:MAG: phosphate ABC transporter substrate-binding protein PstS, partial [Candidatus Binataceae bacterium]